MLSASKSMAMSRNALSRRSQNLLRIKKNNTFHNRNQYRNYSDNTNTNDKASKPFSLPKFLFKLSLLTAAVYGTGAAAALIYEPLQEPFLEYFPAGEQVLDSVDYAWKNRREVTNFDYVQFYNKKYSEIASSVNDTAERLGLQNYINIPHKGIESAPISAETKQILKEEDKKEKFLILSNADKKVSAEEVTIEQPKKVVLPLIYIESSDKHVNDVVASVNKLIKDFNTSKLNEDSTAIIEKISSNLKGLSSLFETKDIKNITNEQLTALHEKFEQEKTLFIENLAKTAESTKRALEKKHKEILDKELEEIKKSLELDYQNKLKKNELDLIEKFNKTVSEKVESERNNKLKNLELLSQRVESIEKFELELSKVAFSYTTFKEFRKSLSKIRSLLLSNAPSDVRGESLVSEINNLKKISKPLNNSLMNAAIDSLPSDKELLINGGVLTQGQILTRWEQLIPELRAVSLLPENPGILGYASSGIFSKFLWSKSGVPINTNDEYLGNDVESVIARVNNYLQKNQLDNAVEEVTSLKGIARELADDWLVDTRRKLEIQFLVDILSTEINVSA